MKLRKSNGELVNVRSLPALTKILKKSVNKEGGLNCFFCIPKGARQYSALMLNYSIKE